MGINHFASQHTNYSGSEEIARRLSANFDVFRQEQLYHISSVFWPWKDEASLWILCKLTGGWQTVHLGLQKTGVCDAW